jgi:hypothetical protein
MIPDPIDSFHLPMGSACLCRRVAGGPRPVVDRLDSIADLFDLDQADDLADRLANRQCPAEWWGLRVDLRCLRAAVDRGGGVSIAVGLSWAMEPSELSPSWNRSSESSSAATGIVRLAIELGGRHQIGH